MLHSKATWLTALKVLQSLNIASLASLFRTLITYLPVCTNQFGFANLADHLWALGQILAKLGRELLIPLKLVFLNTLLPVGSSKGLCPCGFLVKKQQGLLRILPADSTFALSNFCLSAGKFLGVELDLSSSNGAIFSLWELNLAFCVASNTHLFFKIFEVLTLGSSTDFPRASAKAAGQNSETPSHGLALGTAKACSSTVDSCEAAQTIIERLCRDSSLSRLTFGQKTKISGLAFSGSQMSSNGGLKGSRSFTDNQGNQSKTLDCPNSGLAQTTSEFQIFEIKIHDQAALNKTGSFWALNIVAKGFQEPLAFWSLFPLATLSLISCATKATFMSWTSLVNGQGLWAIGILLSSCLLNFPSSCLHNIKGIHKQ